MTPDSILSDAQGRMDKAIDHLKAELRGVRTGRASTSLVEYIKADYYGSPTDIKALAAVSVPEPTQILIKPFDVGALDEIRKALETSDLGLNPQVDGKQIRVAVPSLSGDRRKQLVVHIKKLSEDTKISLRNVRRDSNKHADQLKKMPDSHTPEDEIETLKKEIQDVIKKHESTIDNLVKTKSEEILSI